jgi:hypothetical protein
MSKILEIAFNTASRLVKICVKNHMILRLLLQIPLEELTQHLQTPSWFQEIQLQSTEDVPLHEAREGRKREGKERMGGRQRDMTVPKCSLYR